jgi:hypothetical protein
VNTSIEQGNEIAAGRGARSKFEFKESLKDPDSAVELQIKLFRKPTAPRIIDDDNGANLGCLDDRFSLAAIL